MFTPLVKVEWDLDWDHPYIELVGNPAYRLTPYRRTTSDESVLVSSLSLHALTTD